MRPVYVLIFILLVSGVTHAQWQKPLPPLQLKNINDGTICYHKPENTNLIIPPPAAYEAWKKNASAKTNATTFQVTYVNFSAEAQVAFQKAVDIWANLIESPVPIRILAVWQPIVDSNGSTNTILGGASPWSNFANFDGAPLLATYYPVSLAEKLAGRELNSSSDPDIRAQFNSAFTNWSFRTDGAPVPNQTDFISVVLHEIGHGLGITKAYDVTPTHGIISDFYSPFHIPYDHFIENSNDVNLVQNFDPPSAPLRTELTSGELYFRSPLLPKNTIDNRARIYAPATFAGGSSIAHLDDATYNGTPNALMTPFIGSAEVMHNPGSLVMRMLADMGWVNTKITHTRLPNTENVSTPFLVKAIFSADQKDHTGASYGYNSNEIKLNYTTDGTSFTAVAMTPTGIANEFSATIPAPGSAVTYGYHISVKDNLNRTLTKPGIYTDDGTAPVQRLFVFEVGPDTKGPFFSHVPVAFVKASDTEFEVEAIVSDNIAVGNVFVDYQITKSDVVGSLQTLAMNLVAGTDSTYLQTIPYGGLGLSNGDKIEYRIRAIDQAIAPNTKSIPTGSPGFYNVNVVSLAPTQDSYSNNFDNTTTASQDFFGSPEFSVRLEAGFSNGAIHTNHPYPEGDGFPNNRFEWVYQLRVPVRVKDLEATVKFDEVVLIEPGETGSIFPSEDFYDYVVVDGSKDGGVTWTTLANGYDSRDFTPWLTRYNSATSGNNSTAVGDPNLFRARVMNLQDKFDTGDEVVIRFRLFSDPGAAGWGWAIDNLKIQIDETPPTILHDHIDYVLGPSSVIPITFRPSDASGLDKIFVDLKLNGTAQTEEVTVEGNDVEFTLPFTADGGFQVGDRLEYRIRVTDLPGNETLLPATGFFQVPIISFGTPVTQYVTDFNSANTDFVGNFFSIAQPSGFTNSAVHTPHPYPNGFGLTNNTSNYVLTLTKPVTVAATNAYILFNEIALVEYSGANTKDFIVVEGSKDEGDTWHELTARYAANSLSAWKSIFDVGGNGTSNIFRNRLIDITSSGDFEAGDDVLFRFRISADGAGNGWGWAMDNLSIQGPVTGVKEALDLFVSVYPNPVNDDVFTLEVKGLSAHNGQLQITNLQGQPLINESINLTGNTTRKEFSTSTWADGIYVVRLSLEDGSTVTKKLMKASR